MPEIVNGAAIYLAFSFGLGSIAIAWAREKYGLFQVLATGSAIATILSPAFYLRFAPLIAAKAFINFITWPLFAFGIGLTCILLLYIRKDLRLWKSIGVAIGLIAFIFAACLAYIEARGPSALIYQTNPSDSLMYLTIAESVRTVPVETLLEGANPVASDASAKILTFNPLGLYSARMIAGGTMRIGTMAVMATMSIIADTPPERLLLPFALAHLVIGAISIFGLLVSYKKPILIAAAASIAIVLGAWSVTALLHDAYSQIHSIPMLALLLYGLHTSEARPIYGTCLGGLAIAALLSAYPEISPILILSYGLAAAGMALNIVTAGGDFRSATSQTFIFAASKFGGPFAIGLIILLLTGQLSFILRVIFNIFVIVDGNTNLGSTILDQQVRCILGCILGGTWWAIPVIDPLLGSMSTIVAAKIGSAIAIALIAVATVALVGRGSLPRMSAAFGLAGLLIGTYFIFKANNYPAFKAYFLAAPYLMLTVFLLNLPPLRGFYSTIAKLVTTFATVGVLGVNIFFLFAGTSAQALQYYARRSAAEQRDLLDLSSQRHVLSSLNAPFAVIIPFEPDFSWSRVAIIQLALSRMNFFPVSGYIFDNAAVTLKHPRLAPTNPVRIALVTDRVLATLPSASTKVLHASNGLSVVRTETNLAIFSTDQNAEQVNAK